jgi:hypothetical protein
MTKRTAIAEVVRALAVLAVVLLNFAHVPAVSASAYDGGAILDVRSYCGEPLEDGKTHHAPCHACRIGGAADLPPASPDVQPRLADAVLSPAAFSSFVIAVHEGGAISARGPPAA